MRLGKVNTGKTPFSPFYLCTRLLLSLHKIVRGSAKSIQVKHRFPFLPLLSPFAIFADRITGAEMEWMESFFVLASFSDVFLIILFVPVL